MALSVRHALAFAASLMILGAPVAAHRTAIDQIPNPNPNPGPDDPPFIPVSTYLGGYCDLQGDECGPSDGKALGYQVSLDGGTTYVDRVFVQGNGLLTFGSAVNFFAEVGPNGESLNSLINDGTDPSLLLYGRTLVSAGQNNAPDNAFGGGFMQSATLSIVNNAIKATWYTCASPLYCFTNPYTLTLTPYAQGFQGTFDFSAGSGGSDRGYVVNGVFVPTTGTTFFLPAKYIGLSPSDVPEPASWMMMIGGFGLVGAATRRRKLVAVQVNG